MPFVLNIELTYFEGSEDKYQFIRNFLTDSLEKLEIIPRLHISKTPLPRIYIGDKTGNSMLFELMNHVIQKSEIKPASELEREWYICIIVGYRHKDGYLGIMFDFMSKYNSRNGCALFEDSIWDFSKRERVDYESIFARTLLHEIGHCLNLPHDKEIKVMSPTHELISSTNPPGWNQNIVYDFSDDNLKYINQNPETAKPGGEIDYDVILGEEEITFADSTKYWGNSLKLKIKNCDLDHITDFEFGNNISLLLEIENVSLRSIRIPLSLHQNDENLKISLTSSQGIPIPYRKPVLGCGNSLESTFIQPGKKRLVSLNLFFDSNGYLFPEPGTYLISCSIRKFGKQNIWYKSDNEELHITETSAEKNLLFRKLFNKSFRNNFLVGGGYSNSFLNKCRTKLKDTKVTEFGFSLPIGWIYLHSLKNRIIKETDPLVIKDLKKKIIKVYAQLILEETGRIRRGKLSCELQQLIEDSEVKTKKLSPLLRKEDQEEYLNFKKTHISRMYSQQNKARYEEKILK